MAKRKCDESPDSHLEGIKRLCLSNCNSDTISPPSPPKAEPHLLGIPGELRNQIYRLILVQDDPIKLTPTDHEQPALLRTCKQIRDEATSIFIEENQFSHEIISCEPIIPKLDSGYWLWNDYGEGKRPRVQASLTRLPVWANLIEWIEGWYHDERSALPKPKKENKNGEEAEDEDEEDDEELDEYQQVIYSAFELARGFKEIGADWEQVEGCIQTLRKAVEAASVDPSGTWG